jgi:serine protease Do
MKRRFGVALASAVASLLTLVVAGQAEAAERPGPRPLNELLQKLAPSVVAIRARGHDRMAAPWGLGRFTETGSGVLISDDGRVLTAAYVVHDMDEIVAVFPSGEVVPARVVVSEPATVDLSLLQLDRVPPTAKASPMADSNTVKVGDKVVIVGASPRSPHSLHVGAIKARWAPNTAYRTMPIAEFFQTDATIDTENSGGPMFNLSGEVIGIVSQNISRGDRSEEEGFVVTLNTARRLLLEKRPATSDVVLGACSPTRASMC